MAVAPLNPTPIVTLAPGLELDASETLRLVVGSTLLLRRGAR